MATRQPFNHEAYYMKYASPQKRDYLLEELRKAKFKAPETFSLQLRNRAESRYRRLLNAILKEADKRTAGLTDPAEIIRALNNLTYSPEFGRMCEAAARNVITMLASGQRKSWQAAASASSRGREIYKALSNELTNSAVGQAVEHIVQENAKLIKTVPQNMAAQLSELSKKRYAEGLRPDEITKEILQKQTQLREFEARRIARTESSKASTAITQSRAEAIGLDFYIWRTAKDGDRVRKSHQIMEGVICRWSDPPSPETLAGEERTFGTYHPGGIFNCRCYPRVITSYNMIQFPCKVHKAGSIITVRSLAEFKQTFGLAAA